MRFTFKKSERVCLNRDFQKIMKYGKRNEDEYMIIYAFERVHHSTPEKNGKRLGIIVSRKLAKAHDRNKLKRRLREIFRLNKQKLKNGFDFLFIPKKNSLNLSYWDLERQVLGLFESLSVLKNND